MTTSLPYRLILASASPRRQHFLRELGLEFAVVIADIDETPFMDEKPEALAFRLARAKARAVAGRLPPAPPNHIRHLVIAADTVVALGHEILGKPVNQDDAARMLMQLRDKPHQVHSAVSIFAAATGEQRTRLNTTTVYMRAYNDAEIAAYVASGDPMDKAGAYAIQHPTFDPAWAVQGCISGVMGLPLADLRDSLAEFGVILPYRITTICQAHTRFPCCQRHLDDSILR